MASSNTAEPSVPPLAPIILNLCRNNSQDLRRSQCPLAHYWNKSASTKTYHGILLIELHRLIGSYITRSATGESYISTHLSDDEMAHYHSFPGLFFYECIVTLSQEVDVVWRRKWTAITWLYALTRYCEVLDQIVTFLPVGNITVSRAQ